MTVLKNRYSPIIVATHESVLLLAMFVVTHELENMKTFWKTVCVSLYLQMRSDLEEKFGDQFNLALLNQTLNRPILSLSKLYDSTVHWNIKSSLKCILNFNVEFCLKVILQSIRINFRKRLKGIKLSNSACWQEPQKVNPPAPELTPLQKVLKE